MANSTKVFMGNSLIKLGKKVVAVGKNYRGHIEEMSSAKPRNPVLFLKPTSSYVRAGGAICIPQNIGDVHHELELGVVIGKKSKEIKEADWEGHVAGYVLALDMTARTLQDDAKSAGLPWTTAKCYDTFTPISEFIPKSSVPAWDNLNMWLKVDNEEKQNCRTGNMIHSIPYLLSYISQIMTLEEGDIVITGTPEGVGAVKPGQVISAGIDGLVEISFPVESKSSK